MRLDVIVKSPGSRDLWRREDGVNHTLLFTYYKYSMYL